jgi:predicted RNase H-like nuclease
MGPADVVAVDIPIGLPVAGPRAADFLARKAVGPRWRSVFITPPRAVLDASSYVEASRLCRRLCGTGLSQQAFALGPKIIEVDNWLADAEPPVVEVHPEVIFSTLAGRFLSEPKKTWAGFEMRRRLLADAGIRLDGDLGLAGHRVGPDDVLDAAAAAWTATRVARGRHRRLPDPPEVLSDGRRAAIHA